MKVSRIYPHIKTKGERRHEHEVAVAKKQVLNILEVKQLKHFIVL